MDHLIEQLKKMCAIPSYPKVEEEPAEEEKPIPKLKLKINTSRRVNKQPLWWNRSCEVARKERNRLRKVAVKPDCPEDKKAEFKILDKKFKKITGKAKRDYENQVQKWKELEEIEI